jgi:hypothetical protein
MRTTVLFLFCLLAVAGSARADVARDVLTEIAKCADIVDATDRLKCFDAAVPRAKSALAPPAQEAPKSRSILEWFGFSRPQESATKAEDFGKPAPSPAPEERVTEITAAVIEFARTPRGQSVFILDNGQVWRQIDGDSTVVFDPAPGTTMKVTIEHGALGSYNLTIEGRRSLIKVSRLR